ncbi:MAG: thiamine-phosphate synthase family protein [Natronomonas sp.]
MALQLPSEIVVERFLPTLRVRLAAALKQRGMTQQQIADRLGVTQASVSNYGGGNVTVEERFVEDPRFEDTVERIADGFAAGTMDDYEALAEILELIQAFEDRGPICAVHEAEMPALQGLGCDLCVRGSDTKLQAERAAIASVRNAARMAANTPALVDHVPNVGMNLGTALPDADGALDVAAVPGRLHAMRGRINVPSDPELGASEHVAGMILAATGVDPSLRGAVNLATSEGLLDAARNRGIEPLEFDASYENRRARLEAAFENRGSVPRVVYHTGDFGIEPIAYVLGETAVEAIELAAKLIEDDPA